MISKSLFEKLKKEAVLASKSAYCEYSHFPVGAAVLTSDERIFGGCNVENASFGLTICAERNAIFQAAANGAFRAMANGARQRIIAVVIYTPTPTPASPCGACRQVINEFGPEAEVISFCNGPEVIRQRLSDLLPHAFGPADVQKSVQRVPVEPMV